MMAGLLIGMPARERQRLVLLERPLGSSLEVIKLLCLLIPNVFDRAHERPVRHLLSTQEAAV